MFKVTLSSQLSARGGSTINASSATAANTSNLIAIPRHACRGLMIPDSLTLAFWALGRIRAPCEARKPAAVRIPAASILADATEPLYSRCVARPAWMACLGGSIGGLPVALPTQHTVTAVPPATDLEYSRVSSLHAGSLSNDKAASASGDMPVSEWEYRKIALNQAVHKSDEVDLLNAAGLDGWELIALLPNHMAYLKREAGRSLSRPESVDPGDGAPSERPVDLPAAAGTSAGRGEVKPKYRDPSTNETWSGRGRMATWLKRKQDAGEDIDDYLV